MSTGVTIWTLPRPATEVEAWLIKKILEEIIPEMTQEDGEENATSKQWRKIVEERTK